MLLVKLWAQIEDSTYNTHEYYYFSCNETDTFKTKISHRSVCSIISYLETSEWSNRPKWSYSTVNKLFCITPSPTVGNSGDSCQSPSTKNLISYLHNIDKFRNKKTETELKFNDMHCCLAIPSGFKHQCGRECCEWTSILRRKVFALVPVIKGSQYSNTLKPNHSKKYHINTIIHDMHIWHPMM